MKIRKLAAAIGLGVLVISGLLLAPKQASAGGESYTWKDFRTIIVGGGDTRGDGGDPLYNQLLLYAVRGGQNNSVLTGNQTARYDGTIHVDKGNGGRGCTTSISLYLYSDRGDNQGYLWKPPPYGGTPVLGDSNRPPICDDQDEVKSFLQSYHQQWVTIGGTRGTSPDAPERPDQRRVQMSVSAPDPLSRAPETLTVSIKKDGVVVAEKTGTRTITTGTQVTYPPDQTPVSYTLIFELDPGVYEACAPYAIGPCQKFEKKKYEPLALRYGQGYEMPNQRTITANVQVHVARPCGASLTNNPVSVTLKKPDGTILTQETPTFVSNPRPEEEGNFCTVNLILTRTTVFNDLDEGQYELCAAVAEGCVTIHKLRNQPAEGTLVVNLNEFVPPDETPVCNTGTGFAGFLAFVICPFTALAINASDFIERNLIVPYLTISPLQTDSTIYTLWESVRNISNLVFIVALFIIIFSQATSLGISNYGIKRLLPKLFLVAIASNLSFFIAAFAIDAFNILGSGVAQLALAAIPNTTGAGGPSGGQNAVAALAGFGGLAVAAALSSAGAVLGWLWGLIVAAFVILIVAIIALVSRQIMIILLVVLAPLAFVAWLLPNTERYFTKWHELFLRLLLMQPLIILLFAIGKIFAALTNAGSYHLTNGAGGAEDVAKSIAVLLGFFAAVAPVAALPLLFITTHSMMGWVHNFWQGKVGKPVKAGGEAVRAAANKPRVKGLGYRLASSDNRFLKGLGAISVQRHRRESAAAQRERELKRAQGEYIAGHAEGSERFRRSAAGMGGDEGQQRILATAIAAQEKTRKEERERGAALYNGVLRRAGMDSKTFVAGDESPLVKFLRGAADEVRKDGQVVFNFRDNMQLLAPMLEEAIKQGAVGTIEEARISGQLGSEEQSIVSEVISRNQGTLKNIGGAHLNDMDLQNGRMRDRHGNPVTSPDAMRVHMKQAQLRATANLSAENIAKYDWSVHENLKNSLAGAQGAAILNGLSAGDRNKLKQQLTAVLSNPNTKDKVENPQAVQDILGQL